jgi:hypothetical protein
MEVKRRYRIAKDFYSELNRLLDWDWAVYDTENLDQLGKVVDYPMAVFAKRSDAIAFKRLKEGK